MNIQQVGGDINLVDPNIDIDLNVPDVGNTAKADLLQQLYGVGLIDDGTFNLCMDPMMDKREIEIRDQNLPLYATCDIEKLVNELTKPNAKPINQLTAQEIKTAIISLQNAPLVEVLKSLQRVNMISDMDYQDAMVEMGHLKNEDLVDKGVTIHNDFLGISTAVNLTVLLAEVSKPDATPAFLMTAEEFKTLILSKQNRALVNILDQLYKVKLVSNNNCSQAIIKSGHLSADQLTDDDEIKLTQVSVNNIIDENGKAIIGENGKAKVQRKIEYAKTCSLKGLLKETGKPNAKPVDQMTDEDFVSLSELINAPDYVLNETKALDPNRVQPLPQPNDPNGIEPNGPNDAEDSIWLKLLAYVPFIGAIFSMACQKSLNEKIGLDGIQKDRLVKLISIKNHYKIASIVRTILNVAVAVSILALSHLGFGLGLGIAVGIGAGFSLFMGACTVYHSYALHKNRQLLQELEQNPDAMKNAPHERVR